ncbi:MAG: VOC family protein [Actinomycetota bacterium]|nr:VOC family protein [Actinomycetota bacterium]
MAAFDFRGIDHVNITAPEELMDEVVQWYEVCLGLERLPKPPGTRPGGSWFQIGRQELHISIDPHNPPQTAHFGLVVSNFSEVINALREAGVHIEQASDLPGRHRFYTRDPAGNRLEIAHLDADGPGAS